MATKFFTQTSGGKGNRGLFIERDSKICAAGKPTSQPEQSVRDLLTNYCLQDEGNALIGDSITPLPKVIEYSQQRDMRHASIFSEGHDPLNPPIKTKYQTLSTDLKNTIYKSYWHEVGKAPDSVPFLPEGFKSYDTVLGKMNEYQNLYDVIMPVNPIPDKIPDSKKMGYQVNRNYCLFDPNKMYGHKTNADPSGNFLKSCLRNKKISEGSAMKIPVHEKLAKYQYATVDRLGVARTPNDNIKCVPEGYTFVKLSPPCNFPECLRSCETNPYKEEIKQCLVHLNTLQKCLTKRFDRSFYRKFYLSLKCFDKSESGWLKKQIVYDQCNARYIRFNPSLIEHLLSLWQACVGSQIEYKTFIYVINHNEPSLEIPKIQDIKCIDFRTTYGDSYRYSLDFDKKPMAGLPSGRHFDKGYPVTPDGCCMADRFFLPQESDSKACLCPSIFTLLGVCHRDMYTKRDPKFVRKVFENAGEIFKDETFKTIWEIAKKYHSQDWVCFETFRRAVAEYNICKSTK